MHKKNKHNQKHTLSKFEVFQAAMEYFGVVITALLLTCVAGDTPNCSETYQALLRDAATVKKSCSEASYRDCCQIKKFAPWTTTGTYEVASVCSTPEEPFGVNKLLARCDMESAGGKWMVIQRRINGSVDFYRDWDAYVSGFGDLEGEFWYGLEKIHCLTTRDDVELRIELGTGPEPSIVWTYGLFHVAGADHNYKLTIGQGIGEGGTFDSMAHHNGAQFSTPDRDNDNVGQNCAEFYGGAWWYNACHRSNLNGRFEERPGGPPGSNRLSWHEGGEWRHYPHVQMKIRPKGCEDCDE